MLATLSYKFVQDIEIISIHSLTEHFEGVGLSVRSQEVI